MITIYENQNPIDVYEKDIPIVTVIEELDINTIPDLSYTFKSADWFNQSIFPNRDGDYVDLVRP